MIIKNFGLKVTKGVRGVRGLCFSLVGLVGLGGLVVDGLASEVKDDRRLEELKGEAMESVVMEGGKFYSRYSSIGKIIIGKSKPVVPYPTPVYLDIPGAPYDHMDPIDVFFPPVPPMPTPTPALTPYPNPTPPPVFITPSPTPYPTPYPTPVYLDIPGYPSDYHMDPIWVFFPPLPPMPTPTPALTPYPDPTPPPYFIMPNPTPYPTPYPTPDPGFEFGFESDSPITIYD